MISNRRILIIGAGPIVRHFIDNSELIDLDTPTGEDVFRARSIDSTECSNTNRNDMWDPYEEQRELKKTIIEALEEYYMSRFSREQKLFYLLATPTIERTKQRHRISRKIHFCNKRLNGRTYF